MESNSLVLWLFAMTLLAALAVGVWQIMSVRRSRAKRGEEGHVSTPTANLDTRTPPR